MSDIYFSARTLGFYSTDLHRDIPDDRVWVDAAAYRALMIGQTEGKQIVADDQGAPVLVENAGPPSGDALAAWRSVATASRFQARMALRNAGLFDAAEAAISASGNALLQEAWASASEFRRTSPAILAMGAALGLDDVAVDHLFRDAAQITA